LSSHVDEGTILRYDSNNKNDRPKKAAIIVGGYNSSNTTHLVELLEPKFPCYFINSEENISENLEVSCFDIHTKTEFIKTLPIKDNKATIILTSGASCPDAVVDRVIQKLLYLTKNEVDFEKIIS
jgi:4-hydroxy-3-methylbut-2-enyl diphosphate reductase